MLNPKLGLLVLSLSVSAGCNEVSRGANGNLLFSPTECGREISDQALGCDFDDSIGVGGTVSVTISPVEGMLGTAGLQLVSQTPDILQVAARSDVANEPAWDVTALGAGVGVLAAVDQNNQVVDFLEIGLQDLIGFGLENTRGDAVGPTLSSPNVEEWSVNANESVGFQVVPLISGRVSTMGRFQYQAIVDAAMMPGVSSPENLSSGELQLEVPAGDYQVQFLSGDQTVIARIHAQ